MVSTVQSLLFNNKYQRTFSPTDFDLVISDEAHRSISGNARAVFDYFVGYKLGLTATAARLPKGRGPMPAQPTPEKLSAGCFWTPTAPFGCENREPTFRYSLLDGVRDGVLISPTVVDVRTDVHHATAVR